MASLRKIIDGMMTATRVERHEIPLKEGDQVVLTRKLNRSGPVTRELMVGTIAAMDGQGKATVTLPRPGGRIVRSTVPVSSLTAVSEMYNRSVIQVNPAFRGFYKGSA